MVRGAPEHQIMLALAMLELDEEDRRRIFHKEAQTARTPPRWRRVHARVSRARAALARHR